MKTYKVTPFRGGGWAIVEVNSDRAIILFNDKKAADKALRVLNAEQS